MPGWVVMEDKEFVCLKCGGVLEKHFIRDGVVWLCPQCCRGFYEWMLKEEKK